MKSLSEYITEKRKKVSDILQQQYDDPIKNAVWNYVAGYTTAINDVLRKNKNEEDITKDLDEAFNKFGTKKNIDLYRTVDWDYMKNMYGLTIDNIDEYINKTFQNKGYMSTAAEFISPWGKKWQEYELVMHITGDITYIDINKLFPNDKEIDCAEQKEMLLPRDVTLKLISYDIKKGKQFDKNGTYVLEMEAV